MADELPCACRQAAEQEGKRCLIEISGRRNADRSLCCANASFPNLWLLVEGALQQSEELNLYAAPETTASKVETPRLLEGIADSRDSETFGNTQERS